MHKGLYIKIARLDPFLSCLDLFAMADHDNGLKSECDDAYLLMYRRKMKRMTPRTVLIRPICGWTKMACLVQYPYWMPSHQALSIKCKPFCYIGKENITVCGTKTKMLS